MFFTYQIIYSYDLFSFCSMILMEFSVYELWCLASVSCQDLILPNNWIFVWMEKKAKATSHNIEM
jgi:hypothetical protein